MMNTANKPKTKKSLFKRYNKTLSIFVTLFATTLLINQFAMATIQEGWQKVKLKLHETLLNGNRLDAESFAKEILAEVSKAQESKECVSFLSELSEKGFIIREGDDIEHRPTFVSLQGDFERSLAYALKKNKITHLVGMIHTPTPATPLCTEGEISKDLVHASMEDEKRLFTVMKRPEIVRQYMDLGGTLVAAFPKGGDLQRTEDQRSIYQSLLAKYPYNLVQKELETTTMPWDMVGALYIYKTHSGGWGAFAIMARQANAPVDKQAWGMWFGPINHPMIKQRVENVLQYLYEVGYFDFTEYLIH